MLPVGSACAVILAVALAAWSQSALHFGYAAGAGATVVCYSVSLLLAPKQLPYLRVGVQSPAGRVQLHTFIRSDVQHCSCRFTSARRFPEYLMDGVGGGGQVAVTLMSEQHLPYRSRCVSYRSQATLVGGLMAPAFFSGPRRYH